MASHAFLADAVPPDIWHNVGSTTIAFTPSLLIFGILALYLVGVRRFNEVHPRAQWSMRRTWSFVAGTAVTFLSIELFVGVYDDVLFYDHMIQHLLLIMVAAPLYAMGAPLELLEKATTGRTHRVVSKALGSRAAEVAGHPVTAFVLYALLIPLSHLTSLYNYTLTHDLAHDNEHLAFVVVGYLFWRPIVDIEPSRHRLHPGLAMVMLFLAIPVDTFTGLTLASTTHQMFPYYDTFTRAWGPSRLSDLHIGGAIMWVGGDGIMAFAMFPAIVRWVRYEERRAEELDAILDAQEAAEKGIMER